MMVRSDILSVPFADQKFTLLERQELSRSANGVTRAKSFGSALWAAEWTTGPMLHDDAIDYEARIHALDGAVHQFYAYDLRRAFPRAHSNGMFADTAVIASVGADNKSLSLSGLSSGFTISRGDYFAFNYGSWRALHQAIETVTAGVGGVTPTFEVRPHVRPGAVAGIPVSLKEPSALFLMIPGSVEHQVQSAMFTSVSFKAIQSL